MGHCHAGSQKSYQSDADSEPREEDHCQRGIEASMDLRKSYNIYTIRMQLYNLETWYNRTVGSLNQIAREIETYIRAFLIFNLSNATTRKI